MDCTLRQRMPRKRKNWVGWFEALASSPFLDPEFKMRGGRTTSILRARLCVSVPPWLHLIFHIVHRPSPSRRRSGCAARFEKLDDLARWGGFLTRERYGRDFALDGSHPSATDAKEEKE